MTKIETYLSNLVNSKEKNFIFNIDDFEDYKYEHSTSIFLSRFFLTIMLISMFLGFIFLSAKGENKSVAMVLLIVMLGSFFSYVLVASENGDSQSINRDFYRKEWFSYTGLEVIEKRGIIAAFGFIDSVSSFKSINHKFSTLSKLKGKSEEEQKKILDSDVNIFIKNYKF